MALCISKLLLKKLLFRSGCATDLFVILQRKNICCCKRESDFLLLPVMSSLNTLIWFLLSCSIWCDGVQGMHKKVTIKEGRISRLHVKVLKVPYPLQTVELLRILKPMEPRSWTVNSPRELCCKFCQTIYQLVSWVLAVGFDMLPVKAILTVSVLKNLCQCS